MSITSVLKTVEKVGVKAAQVGDVLGVPVVSQINTALEIIDKSSAEAHDKAAAKALIENAVATPIIVNDAGATEQPVGGFDSKRFKALVGAVVAVLCARYLPGITPDQSSLIAELVSGLAAVYIFHETWRPSGTSKN